jgi:hypothetical protein
MVRTLDPAHTARRFRRFGGTVLRCPLDDAQDAEIRAVLTAGTN